MLCLAAHHLPWHYLLYFILAVSIFEGRRTFLKKKIYFIVLTCIFAGVFILLVISYAKVTCTDAGSPNDELVVNCWLRLSFTGSITDWRNWNRWPASGKGRGKFGGKTNTETEAWTNKSCCSYFEIQVGDSGNENRRVL